MRRLRYYPAPLAHVVDDFEGDTSERLAGRVTVPAVKDPERHPMVYVYAFALRRRPPKGCDESIRCVGDPDPDSIPEDEDGYAILPKGQPLFWIKGKRWHAARMETDPDHHNRLFLRAGDCIEIARDLDNAPFYARVYHLRKWLLLLPLAIAALVLCLSLTFCCSGSGGSSLAFLDGQKSTGETSQPVVSIDQSGEYDVNVAGVIRTGDTVTATATHAGFINVINDGTDSDLISKPMGDAARNPGNLTCKVTQGKSVWTADEVSTMQDDEDGNARVVGTTAKDSYSITGDVRNSNQFNGEITYNFTTSKPNM